MRITLLTTNVRVCRSGRFVCVLPDVAAKEWLEEGELRRFPFDLLPATQLYAARRETDDADGAAGTVIEAVRGIVERVGAEIEEMRRGDEG
jgi:DNA-binding transcriptional LysR family regulator